MKPRSVTIIPTEFLPGELDGFPDGAWCADVVASYPNGDTFTKSTRAHLTPHSMMGQARAIQRDLFKREYVEE